MQISESKSQRTWNSDVQGQEKMDVSAPEERERERENEFTFCLHFCSFWALKCLNDAYSHWVMMDLSYLDLRSFLLIQIPVPSRNTLTDISRNDALQASGYNLSHSSSRLKLTLIWDYGLNCAPTSHRLKF